MAYDDDGSRFNFTNLEDFAILLERYLSAPENLSAARLLALTQAVHVLTGAQAGAPADIKALAQGLRERGLHNIPFDTVTRMLEHVSKFDPNEDALARVTLRDVQRILSR